MDIGTIIGLVLGTVCIIWSMILGGSLLIYYDLPSVVIVFGGVTASVFIKFPMDSVKKLFIVVSKTIFFKAADVKATIDEVGRMADIARRESIFALEKVEVNDAFLKKAMSLAADNRPPEVISAILSMEVEAMEQRHKTGMDMMEHIGLDGPAFGMIGTLIGLVAMLQNLSDPSAIGPAMAVALLTTLYGAVLANLFCNPFKMKLDARSKQEVVKMNIILAGTLGIVAGENPRLIKEKLNSFLPPQERVIEEEKK